MGLEKLSLNIKKLKKGFRNTLAVLSLSAILSSCPSPIPEPKPEPMYDYNTTVKIVASKNININGGSLEVTDSNSFLYNSKLAIPKGALNSNKTISIAEVNNPPALPAGLGYVGSAMDLEPDETTFNLPAKVVMHYNDEFLSDAGISDDSNLGLYSYNNSLKNWEEVNTFSLDTINNKITAEIDHFSYYAITCMNAIPPEDLGTPKPGDLLYTVGKLGDEGNSIFFNNWMPGHVGIYTGEKEYLGTSLASEDVKKFETYNVIEALWDGVQYSYYDISNTTETFESSLKPFNGGNLYMGAREPKDWTLTPQQRLDIVTYAEAQIGKPYAQIETTIGSLFGMAKGSLVKGPDSFNCVGLAEKSYEIAGVNNGDGLTTWWQEELGTFGLPAALTPAEQYNSTKPAASLIPILSFTRLGSNYDPQIAIMNEDGSELQEITSGSLKKNYPRLSSNRDKIIFELHENDNSTLYIMDGSGLTKLRSESRQPSWSIKNKIAFVPRYGFQVIYLFDLSNPSVEEKLTSTYVVEKTPSFSPDGNYIVYNYNNRDINLIDLATRTPVTLIHGDDDITNIEPRFSPDGKKIAFSSNMYEKDNPDIYIYDISSKNIKRLTNSPSYEFSPHFSQDGSKIFFASDLDYTPQIHSMNLDGSNQKQLTYGPKYHDFGYYD